MSNPVYVIGVGMTPFVRPGSDDGRDYPDMAREAGTAALDDAGIDFPRVEQAYVGHCFGDSCSGHRALYELGMTGLPILNVNSNCSTGSSALYGAAQTIRGGLADVTMALGFEKMQRGSLSIGSDDREPPLGRHVEAMARLRTPTGPPAPWMFGAAGIEHNERYGSTPEHWALVAEKNHRHSVHNPYAQFRDELSLEQIRGDRMIYAEAGLTRSMCSPTSDGAGAAILASERFVEQHDLGDRAVEILAQSVVTDVPGTWESDSMITLVGGDMTRRAADEVYEQGGFGPEDVAVIELHDCFAPNEVLSYEGLRLCDEGTGHLLVEQGQTTHGGRWVVNPSGGLISKGHPLGATGLAQCAELTWQLRGEAGGRQVPAATADGAIALQHNIGLGGTAVVTAYRRATGASR